MKMRLQLDRPMSRELKRAEREGGREGRKREREEGKEGESYWERGLNLNVTSTQGIKQEGETDR